MKCQYCKNAESNFHYTSHINGRAEEIHLCSACARELGYDRAFTSFRTAFFPALSNDLFSGFFRSPMAFAPAGLMSAHRVAAPVREREIPADLGEDIKRRRALNELRAGLQKAVETEQYEKAAVLRDEIYRFEKDAQ